LKLSLLGAHWWRRCICCCSSCSSNSGVYLPYTGKLPMNGKRLEHLSYHRLRLFTPSGDGIGIQLLFSTWWLKLQCLCWPCTCAAYWVMLLRRARLRMMRQIVEIPNHAA